MATLEGTDWPPAQPGRHRCQHPRTCGGGGRRAGPAGPAGRGEGPTATTHSSSSSSSSSSSNTDRRAVQRAARGAQRAACSTQRVARNMQHERQRRGRPEQQRLTQWEWQLQHRLRWQLQQCHYSRYYSSQRKRHRKRQRPPQQPAQAAPQAASGRQQRVAMGSRASGASNAQLGLVRWGGVSTARTALAFVSLACLRARRPAGMTQLRGRGPGDVHGHDHGDGHRHGLEPAQGRTKFSTRVP